MHAPPPSFPADAPGRAPPARCSARDWGLAAAAAIAWVLGLDLLTNSTPPLWDATSYVDVAREGLAGNPHLVAPFAWRPGAPLLARCVAELLGRDVLLGFELVTRAAVFATLLLAWRFSRALAATGATALVVQAVVALSFFHAKLPLFFPTLVDASAYPWLLGACIALVERRFLVATALALVGLAFKEFLLVPCAMIAWQLARERRFAGSALVVVATGVAFVGLRAAIPVESSRQFVDLSSVENVWIYLRWAPMKWERDVNVVFSFASYFLPVLVLVTRERWRAWRSSDVRASAPFGLALLLVVLLALYGGTNVSTFASYALPVELAVLAAFLSRNPAGSPAPTPGRAELTLLLVALLVFNRIPFELPVPDADARTAASRAYLDVYAGWGSRLAPATLHRTLELFAWIAAAWGLRRFTRAG